VYIDLDYYPDLFPLVVFAALGFGIIVSALNRSQQLGVAAILLIIVAINAGLALGIGPLTGYSPLSATDQAATQLSIDTPPKMNVSAERGPYYNESASEFMNDLYWNRQIPEYCHYRFAGGELRWLEQTNQTYDDDCGVPPPNSPLNLLY